jgi:hypothetical protein
MIATSASLFEQPCCVSSWSSVAEATLWGHDSRLFDDESSGCQCQVRAVQLSLSSEQAQLESLAALPAPVTKPLLC